MQNVDPFLSANIYWAGHLDEAAFQIVLPAWRTFCESDPEHGCSLWMMRYGRGGEHLKVRVQGSEVHRSHFAPLLESAAISCLAEFPPSDEVVEKRGWVGAPPIDDEDRAEVDHPDRNFLWTHYGRSHVSLGGQPFLDHDQYVAHVTACLSCACDLVLALEPERGAIPHKLRQSTLLKALIGGLAACGFRHEELVQYLTYHRDWLLRFILPKDRRFDIEPVTQILARFDGRVSLIEGTIRTLATIAAEEWRGPPQPEPVGLDAAWRASLKALLEYVEPFCADPAYRLDPFAVNPAFAPIFKVFHGLANQLGLNLADEAFAHHLLLRAALSVDDSPGTC